MKKVIHAIKQKKEERREKKKPTSNLKITNDTVAEHREQVLADGKKFKYPVQYARHKLVINTVILSVVALGVFTTFTWWQLYQEKASNTFFYRVTQIVPLPVASVDGDSVRYSDFLLFYRPSVHFLREVSKVDLSTDDGKRQTEYFQREALKKAIESTYVAKIARERNITVSSDEIDSYVKKIRTAANDTISEQASNTSNRQIVGISSDELRHFMRNSILRSKVVFALDEDTKKASQDIAGQIASGKDLEASIQKYKESYGDRVVVRKGLSLDKNSSFAGVKGQDIAAIGKGKVSDIIENNDNGSYVIIKIVDVNDTTVSFDFVQVTTSKLQDDLAQLRESGKIKEYITTTKEESNV